MRCMWLSHKALSKLWAKTHLTLDVRRRNHGKFPVKTRVHSLARKPTYLHLLRPISRIRRGGCLWKAFKLPTDPFLSREEIGWWGWESGGWSLHPPTFPDLWEINIVWAHLGQHLESLDNNKDFPSCSLLLTLVLLKAWFNSSQRTITASATSPF